MNIFTNKHKIRVLAFSFFAFLSQASADYGVLKKPGMCTSPDSNECGWWWGFEEKEPVEKKPIPTKKPEEKPEEKKPEIQIIQAPESKKKEQDCTKAEEWTKDCGFVDPGDNFEFQSKQRDELLRQSIFHGDDPQKVEQFQRYLKWLMNKAIMAAKSYKWNMVQKQDLNPETYNPVSTLGFHASTSLADNARNTTIKFLTENKSYLVLLSKSDCSYCHMQADTLKRAQTQQLTIPVFNVAMDGKCLDGFKEGINCINGNTEAAKEIFTKLGAEIVPDILLRMPTEDMWIRISSGYVTTDVILDRIHVFVNSVARASLKSTETIANKDGVGIKPGVKFVPESTVERSKYGVQTIK